MTVETLFLLAFILLIAEAFIPSLGLLGLGGFIAFVCGLVLMRQSGMSDLYGLSFEAVAALGCLVFLIFAVFGYFVVKSFRKKVTTGLEYMIGQKAEVTCWKPDKGKGKIMFEGEDWRSVSKDFLALGDRVVITGYDKMTLTVKKDG